MCHDRYTEIKRRGKYKIVDEKWYLSDDFGFHKWPGRQLEGTDHFTLKYPREIIIVDDQGKRVIINLLSGIDYDYALGKLTSENWAKRKTDSPQKGQRMFMLTAFLILLFWVILTV